MENRQEANYNPALLTEEAKQNLSVAVIEQQTSVMNPVEHEQLRRLANEYFKSGAVPTSYQNADQILLAMQFGRTMGMTPHESVVNGYFINGSYNVYGKAIPAALRRHGWSWKFVDESDIQCGIVLSNAKTGETIEDNFLYQDAVDSGHTTKYNKATSKYVDSIGWKKGANRKRKLRYGVLSLVLHTYLPDVLGAVAGVAEYTEDYIEGVEVDKEQRDQERAERIEKAAAARATMNDAEPTVVEPVETPAQTEADEAAETATPSQAEVEGDGR